MERRRTYRVNGPEAYARCSTGDVVGYYSVKDVSTGGVLLQGRPLPPLDAEVEVLLLLPGQRPCVVEAHVLRECRASGTLPEVALEFVDLSADVEDAIEDFIAAELTRQLRPVALVAADGTDGEALERSLRLAGCPAVRVHAPLEAIARLEQPDGVVGTVFLGERFGGARGTEMAAFLEHAYPSIRRVVVTHAPDEAVGDAILPAPWTDTLVEDVLFATT